MSRLAIIAGSGDLPAILVAALPQRPLICALEGLLPSGVAVDLVFRVERLALFLRHLQDCGVSRVVFAGAVQRPRLDPSLFDPHSAQLVPRLLAAMQAGDDATLREVLAIFEEAGFGVVGVPDIAPGLLPGAGILAGAISPVNETDAARAGDIVAALGAVDVGQACVVAAGLCLGVEALPGTDAMLENIAALPATLRPQATGGVLYKAAKPGQDRRIDLPTIGLRTVQAAAAAGLDGIVWAAGDVICLDLPGVQAEASRLGLFLWAR